MAPKHLEPDSCFVCGINHADKPDSDGHVYWSNADAKAEAEAHDRQMRPTRSAAAAYVEQHRPY